MKVQNHIQSNWIYYVVFAITLVSTSIIVIGNTSRDIVYISDMPDDLPSVEIDLSGNQTDGTLTFEATNIFDTQSNYMMEVNTSTGAINMARRFEAFGMKFERHNEDFMSFYEYTNRVWNGQANFQDYGGIRFHTGGVMRILDNEYRVIRTIEDGINIDSHDLVLLDDGSWLYFAPDTRALDRSQSTITCLLDCFLIGQSLIRIDAQNNQQVIWSALDYYEQRDFVMDDVFELNHNILYDVIHANSVNLTPDGNLIISMRHTDEVMVVSIEGDMLWRSRDYYIPSPFAHQHDAHILGNGNLLLFDNGNGKDEEYSRAVEYEIDHDLKTMNAIWQYDHNEHFAPTRGSVQRLSNGNTLINFVYGGIVEVDENGTVLMEITMPDGYASYQARIR